MIFIVIISFCIHRYIIDTIRSVFTEINLFVEHYNVSEVVLDILFSNSNILFQF